MTTSRARDVPKFDSKGAAKSEDMRCVQALKSPHHSLAKHPLDRKRNHLFFSERC